MSALCRIILSSLSAIVVALMFFAHPAAAAEPEYDLADNTFADNWTDATYRFTTRTPYWSLVALATFPAGNDAQVLGDWDMMVRRTDADGSTTRVSSTYGTGKLDFIAIDSNRPGCLGRNYTARLTRYSGDATYSVSFNQGRETLEVDATYPVPNNEVTGWDGFSAMIWDVRLVAGQKIQIRVKNMTSDPTKVWLMGTDPAASDECAKSRASSLAHGTVPSRADAAAFDFTAPFTGWYGVVNTSNNSGENYAAVQVLSAAS